MKRTLILSIFLSLAHLTRAEIPPEQLDFFETHVRPNLIKYCYECHSVESGEARGGLYLDTREGMVDGGSTGPLFEGEYPLFIDAITWADPDFEMPPKEKMPEDVIEKLVEWFEMGAPDPRERETFVVESKVDLDAARDHWAYQRPVRPAERSIDEIVQKKRSAEGVESVASAHPLQLLRRVTFDLTGLPPTPPEVQAFLEASEVDQEAAFARKIEDLLASPHYGERWGRHWLDAVRYGESSGTHNIVYPYAWRFRDYVIDSFNEDKRYDRLITEHLAGDLLPASNDEQRQEQLIATGFLALGPKKQNEKNRETFKRNLIDEQIDTTTRAFMATTVACARCHDHKFDPIGTTDYYAMSGIFESTETLWGTIAGNQNHRTSDLVELPIADAHVDQEDQRQLYEEKLAEFEEVRAQFQAGRRGNRPEEGFDNRAHVKLKQQFMRLRDELEFMNPDGTAKTYGMGARESMVVNSNVLVSGDINKPAQAVDRGFPEVFQFQGTPDLPADSSGRLELAQWITSPNNPLTARVMVNRVWMHLTGTPIVETMDNFGTTGLPPANQELLDYLAIRFVESGWSVKTLIREIVHTDTYKLASTFNESNYAKDPDNKTHWRANPRQLDAEALRDQMLLVSAQLDRERPAGSIAANAGDDARIGDSKRDSSGFYDTAEFRHRSIYLPVFREALPDELGLFDFPDPLGTIGQRSTTNVAPQSLHLMNSELVKHQSVSMAEILQRNFPNLREQVSKAYLLAYSRPATDREVSAGVTFVQSFDPGDPPAPEPEIQTPVRPRRPGAMTEDGQMRRGPRAQGQGGPRRRMQEQPETTEEPAEPEPEISSDLLKLSAFCQALMMSAEFRMIH